jgi:predicted permease
MGVFGELIAIIAPVLAVAGIGYFWARRGEPFDTKFVTRISLVVGSPCLAFSALTRYDLTLGALAQFMLANVLTVLFAAVVGLLVLRAFRLAPSSYLPSLIFSNGGNMGLPLSLFAFGEPGLALGVCFFAANSVGNFTIGQALAAGKLTGAAIVKSPVIWAVAAALIFIGVGAKPPRWLANTTQLLGQVSIPLMLLTLGHSLARLMVASLKLSLGLATLRLAVGFTGGVVVAWLLGLDEVARGVLILQASMPVAVYNYLFAQAYNRDHETVAGMVVISTLLSFVTLPALLYFLLGHV